MPLPFDVIARQFVATLVVWLIGGCVGLAAGYSLHKFASRWILQQGLPGPLATMLPWRAFLASTLVLVWGPSIPRYLGVDTFSPVAVASLTLLIVSLPIGARLHRGTLLPMVPPSPISALRSIAVLSALLTLAAGWAMYWGVAGVLASQSELGATALNAWWVVFVFLLVVDIASGLVALALRRKS